jgi:hypothetical protein
MSARDRKLILVALLFTAAGGAIYWQFFGGAVSIANSVTGPRGADVPPPDRINVGQMGGSEAVASADRNPFSFGREVVIAPPPPVVVIPPPPPPPPPPQPPPDRGRNPQTTTASTAPTVPLNYTGYARDDENQMIAFLETTGTGAPLGHYNLKEDDFLLGRFRVSKITPESVEVEDLERSEKRTINISPQLAPVRR